MPISEIYAKYRQLMPEKQPEWVIDALQIAHNMEFKRRQLPPTARVSARTFDWMDRRVPITARKVNWEAKAHACADSTPLPLVENWFPL